MRSLLRALPFVLLPLAGVQASAQEHGHSHDNPEQHQHGMARLDLALDGQRLEVELQSPSINLLGFEHLPQTSAQRAQVAAVRDLLEQPQALLALPEAAACALDEANLESPLLAHAMQPDAANTTHSEIAARYGFTCSTPQNLDSLDLAALFKAFPGLEHITVQLIGPHGQKGGELLPGRPSIDF